MGRQVRFWMLPEDEAAFALQLRPLGAVWLRMESRAGGADIIASLPETRDDDVRDPNAQVWIAHKEMLGSLQWQWVEPRHNHFLDDSNSPTITFTRCRMSRGGLVSGRIWAEMTELVKPAEEEMWIRPKSEDFIRFYKDVSRIAQKLCPTGPISGYRCAPAARRWHAEGGSLFERDPGAVLEQMAE